jgi:uncharacterized protein (DUF58 family)
MLAEHVESLGPAYRQALVAHRAGLQAIVRAVGWSCTVHHTDARPTLPLLALHALLARR